MLRSVRKGNLDMPVHNYAQQPANPGHPDAALARGARNGSWSPGGGKDSADVAKLARRCLLVARRATGGAAGWTGSLASLPALTLHVCAGLYCLPLLGRCDPASESLLLGPVESRHAQQVDRVVAAGCRRTTAACGPASAKRMTHVRVLQRWSCCRRPRAAAQIAASAPP